MFNVFVVRGQFFVRKNKKKTKKNTLFMINVLHYKIISRNIRNILLPVFIYFKSIFNLKKTKLIYCYISLLNRGFESELDL